MTPRDPVPEIAVLVKTREREEALLTCLRSVTARLPAGGYRLYVADDGTMTERKAAAYDRLRGGGHVVELFEERVGVTRARNRLLERLEDEGFVLRMDDDFEMTGETDVAAMREILEAVPALGVMADLERQVGDGKGVFSGQISDAQGFFEVEDGVLVRRMVPLGAFGYEEAAGHRYARCDFTRNMLLVRREVFGDVRWEERLPFVGEHADFLLQVRDAGWDVAFTPDSVHRHRDDLGPPRPLFGGGGRWGEEEAARVYREKWGVRGMKVRRPWTSTLRAAAVKAKVAARRLLGGPS